MWEEQPDNQVDNEDEESGESEQDEKPVEELKVSKVNENDLVIQTHMPEPENINIIFDTEIGCSEDADLNDDYICW